MLTYYHFNSFQTLKKQKIISYGEDLDYLV